MRTIPAAFDFPVARPLPIDSSHIEMIHVEGHRYVIRYELNRAGTLPCFIKRSSITKSSRPTRASSVEKSGAVGDVTETFFRGNTTHQIWVYLEPAVSVNVLTVVESTRGTLPPLPRLMVDIPTFTPATPAVSSVLPAPAMVPAVAATPTLKVRAPDVIPAPPASVVPISTDVDVSHAAPPTPLPAPEPEDDSLYASLSDQGRVILPFVFQPGKDEIDASSQPLVDRVVAMMKRHPDLLLRIEGHTDNVGDSDDNLRLSAQRALAVRAKLIDANIDKKRLDAVGVGGLQPLADNATAEGREKNRRIELVMWQKYPAFHAAAPNGNNYYPNPGQASN